MKWRTSAAVALGLAASVASAALVEFNQDLLAFASQRNNAQSRITFNMLDAEPLPPTLPVHRGNYGGPDRILCSMSEEYTNSGEVTVLLAISKCLNQSSIDLIEAWISKVKAEHLYYEDKGVQKEITFSTTLIPGACEARTELEKAGRSERVFDQVSEDPPHGDVVIDPEVTDELRPASSVLLSEHVARIQAFAKFGRVLESLDDFDASSAVAVLSFVNTANSYEYITTYESTYKLPNTFHFQICQDGESCSGHFENCIQLEESVDLFMYNPFQITRSLQCNDLQGGIPVSFLDEHGERQCFCTCPAGSTLQGDRRRRRGRRAPLQCVVVEPDTCPCTWSTHPFGFRYENTEKLEVCAFSDIATKWGVPVPFPSDNYVADHRVNNKDSNEYDLENGPHIDLVVSPQHDDIFDRDVLLALFSRIMPGEVMPELPTGLADMFSVYGQGELSPVLMPRMPVGTDVHTRYTWKDYQLHRQQKIDDITFTAYGKYELTLEAHDYTANSAACVGCVAVVDKFRPKATSQCPASFCDNTTSLCSVGGETAVAELTLDNLAKANALVGEFYKFKEAAENDACASERCDDDHFEYRNFFESSSSCHDKSFLDGKTCFSPETMIADFAASAIVTANPLQLESGAASQSPHPVDDYQCMRCCEYSTQLREFWVDYTCGYGYEQRYCDGDADQQCAFKQCLVLTGDMVVRASASIRDEVKEASAEVLKELADQGFQTYTQIHKALSCSDFGDSACSYEASISQLIEVEAPDNLGIDASVASQLGIHSSIAFWRYKIDGDAAGWRLWEDATPYAFAAPQTKITVEAWTACGRARKFYFYVHLHPHTDIKVCDVFRQMWYQTSKSRVEVPTEFCAFPGSDFAELTFDYQANVGLKHSRNSVAMHIAKVTCELAFQDRTPAQILTVEADSQDIVERFAIELQNQDETKPFTQFTIECQFSYTGPSGVVPVEQTCPLDLTITDCNGPAIDIPKGECQWDDCAGQGKPGPFEACGGKVVRATATATYLDTEDQECCQACGKHTPSVCTPILNLPDITKDIKRCVPQLSNNVYQQETYGNYDFDGGYYDQASVFMAKAVASHPTVVAATAMLAASALVAVVALVVVRRRRALAAEAAVVIEDAYYPLLH
jgi:hypothetical protein